MGNEPADARFSPASGTTVRSTPKWIALPNLRCAGGYDGAYQQAIVHSEYALFPNFNGQPATTMFTRTPVQVPWGILPDYSLESGGPGRKVFASALTGNTQTNVFFGEAICDALTCRTNVSRLHDFTRVPGNITYAPGLAQSQFFGKTARHERDHVNYQVDPWRCGSNYWTEERLIRHFERCAQDSSVTGCVVPIVGGDVAAARAEVRVREALNLVTWQVDEGVDFIRDRAGDLAEKEA